ncbi:MAG: PD40 domain-containing protein [Bacteroidetes bacterium]|nr:PD40 domain-containing protein [Bacteroidota bacterium]
MKQPAIAAISILLLLLTACSGGETVVREDAGAAAGGDLPVYNCFVLNSSADDFSPFLSADGSMVFFTSTRSAEERSIALSREFGYGEAVFVAEKRSESPALQLDQTGAWTTPLVYRPEVFGRVNTGTLAFDAEGEMYVSSGTYLDGGEGGADLFRVTALEGALSVPQPVEAVNSPWWDSHPTVSPDGRWLVFASDRIDAAPSIEQRGRRDPQLWISARQEDGSWGAPDPLPSPVNSGTAEMSPHFSPDGILYFATRRWPDAGFEIVRSRRHEDGSWSEVERMTSPINSAANDCFPFITPDRLQILLASDRPGGMGGYDIYCGEVPYCINAIAEVQLVEPVRDGQAQRRPGPQIAMEIIDIATGRTVATGRTSDDGRFAPEVCLRAGKTYELRPGNKQCYQAAAAVPFTTPVPDGDHANVSLAIDLERPLLPEFQVLTDTIPFFVTGYWYPNTPTELERLHSRVGANELPNANFIDLKDYDYTFAAERVDRWFEHLYSEIENMLVPMLDTCYTGVDTLLISVLGHVDSRGLAWGRFDEQETVRTQTMTITPGTVMQKQDGNEKLSHLRAYYTMRMIDREMRERSPRFRLLRGQNRIRFIAEGKYIAEDEGPTNDPYQRKFIVNIEVRHGHDEPGS